MKLKGSWDDSVAYEVGDVVQYTDKQIYHLQNPAPTGTTPVDTLYWGKLDQDIAQCVGFIMDALGIASANAEVKASEEVEKYFLNDQTLILKTGEDDSVKSYAITVDDSGVTPELAVDEIVEEGSDT